MILVNNVGSADEKPVTTLAEFLDRPVSPRNQPLEGNHSMRLNRNQ